MDSKLPQELLSLLCYILTSSIRCQRFWNSKAVEGLSQQACEVVGSSFSCEDLQPVTESVNDQAEVVPGYGEVVRAHVLEWILRGGWCDRRLC